VSPTQTSPDIPAASDTRREIQVEIPAAEVVRETDKLIQKYQKLARSCFYYPAALFARHSE
jgi:hypothetical protein